MRKTELKILLLTIAIAVLIIAVSVILFNINVIGNRLTIGQFSIFFSGIIGTTITFAGLYFIYQTYLQQSKQLRIAQQSSDLEIINKLYNDLIHEINSIQYRRTNIVDNGTVKIDINNPLFQGIDALYNFDRHHWVNPNSVINHLNSIVLSFEQLIMMANKILYSYQDIKEIMLTKIYFLYYSKIVWPACDMYTQRDTLGLTKASSDSMLFFSAYEKMTKESIKYLMDRKRITKPEHPIIGKLVQ